MNSSVSRFNLASVFSSIGPSTGVFNFIGFPLCRELLEKLHGVVQALRPSPRRSALRDPRQSQRGLTPSEGTITLSRAFGVFVSQEPQLWNHVAQKLRTADEIALDLFNCCGQRPARIEQEVN